MSDATFHTQLNFAVPKEGLAWVHFAAWDDTDPLLTALLLHRAHPDMAPFTCPLNPTFLPAPGFTPAVCARCPAIPLLCAPHPPPPPSQQRVNNLDFVTAGLRLNGVGHTCLWSPILN